MNNPVQLTATAEPGGGVGRLAATIVGRHGIVVAFIVLVAILALSNEFFMTWNNWTNIIRQTAINGILAIGVTFVILAKGIDLSVGSIAALSGAVAASFVVTPDPAGMGIAIIVGVAVGTVLGLVPPDLRMWGVIGISSLAPLVIVQVGLAAHRWLGRA